MNEAFLIIMYICHYVGDYYLQTSKIAANKMYSYNYTALHSALYASPFELAAVLWKFDPVVLLAVLVAVGSHFLIDMGKCAWICSARNKHTRLVYILDQTLHIVILYFCGSCGVGSMPLLPLYEKWLYIVLYVVALLQPAYISYEVLFSTDRSGDCMKGRKQYIFKAASITMGILLFFRLYPAIVAGILAAVFILLKQDKRLWREGLRMCTYIVCASLIIFTIMTFGYLA